MDPGALFRWLSTVGTKGAPSASQRRRIGLTNQCAALVAATFAFVAGAAVFFSGLFSPIFAASAAGAAIELLAIWLNVRGKTLPARYLVLIAANLGNLGATYLLGAHSVFVFYFFPLAVVPFFLFENEKRWHRAILAVLSVGSFMLTRWSWPAEGALLAPLSHVGLVAFEAVSSMFVVYLLAMVILLFADETARAEAKAAEALARSEELLLNILPASISERLKTAGQGLGLADHHAEVTVLFADLVGFTELSASLAPGEVVRMLNDVFSRFDDLSQRFGLEKIKTIGDAYMVASGLPESRRDHVNVVARMALEMQRVIHELNRSREAGKALQIRIGMHTGPVVAGVIGKRKFIYDLWGDTVNTASRMESSGLPGEIQVTQSVHDALGTRFVTELRGTVQVKGKGAMETYLLRSEASA